MVSSEPGAEFLERPSIENMSGLRPTATRGRDRPAHIVQLACRVGITGASDQDSPVDCPLDPDVREVEPIRLSVDLDRDPIVSSGIQHGFEIDLVRESRGKQASGGMTEDVDMGVGERTDDAFRHAFLRHIEGAVHGHDHEIEFGENLVRIVECPVRQNVNFGALQDTKWCQSFVEFADPLALFAQTLDGQAAGHGEGSGMIRNDQVLVAARASSFAHPLEWLVSVAPIGVHMEVAADIPLLDKHGQAMLAGRLDLTTVLPQLGWNPIHSQKRIDLMFRFARQKLAGFVKEAVLGEFPATLLDEGA